MAKWREVECLIWYDCPRLSILADDSGAHFLAVNVFDYGDEEMDYGFLVAPMSPEDEAEMLADRLVLRDIFLKAPVAYLWNYDEVWVDCEIPVPEEFLPGKRAKLKTLS
jgi:hypothetical protein